MMKNLHTFNEFINEDLFNLFNFKEDKKITREMKVGQIVCILSDKDSIIHVFQLIDPLLDKGIFIGNFKLSDENNWIFKISRYIKYDPNTIKRYRPLNMLEKKMIKWYFSSNEKIKNLTDITKIQPIF